MTTRPTLYAQRPIPFMELSPDEFQSFAFAAMQVLGPVLGVRIDQLPGPGGDGGYDAYGTRLSDNAAVCVQCKRWQRLDLGTVAHELAKVAMTSAREGTRVAEHFIVAAGGVNKNVDTAVRQDRRTSLLEGARTAGNSPELARLRTEVIQRQLDPDAVISGYVLSVVLHVWSGGAFDAQLAVVWSQLDGLIARFFNVHAVLREHPRPDFDERAHLARLPSEQWWVDRLVRRTTTPPRMRAHSAASPVPPLYDETAPEEGDARKADEVLANVPPGVLTFFTARGGAGKSTTLIATAYLAASRRVVDDSAPIPVLVFLKDYRDSVDSLLREELAVKHGRWRNLPGPFLLLFDGLNELPPTKAQQVVSEIAQMSREHHLAFVVSLREVGPDQPVVLSMPSQTWTLASWTTGDIQALAAKVLHDRAVLERFMHEVWRHSATSAGAELFGRPFNVRLIVETFARTHAVPATVTELVRQLLDRRFRRNEELDVSHALPSPVQSTLASLAAEVAYDLRVVQRRRSASRDEIQDLVYRARLRLLSHPVFGADAFSDVNTLDALVRHEYLSRSRLDRFSFDHDIVSGYLASKVLASQWGARLDTLDDPGLEDVWMFVAVHVPAAERAALLAEVAVHNTQLAVQMAQEAAVPELAEQILLKRASDLAASDLVATRWMVGAAFLGTSAVLDLLRNLRTDAAVARTRRTQAWHALALAGDEAVLREAQRNADQLTDPMLHTRGGPVPAWEQAPPARALALAREWIDLAKDDQRVGASALTLGQHGNASDAARLEAFIQRSTDHNQTMYAWGALRVIDPDRARVVFNAIVATARPAEKVSCYAMLVADNQSVDITWLISVLTASEIELARTSNISSHDAYHMQRTAAEILARSDVSLDQRALLVSHYPAAENKDLLWRIARRQCWPEFDDLAFKEARCAADINATDAIVDASAFAAVRDWPLDRRTEFDEIRMRFVKCSDDRYSVNVARVLEDLANADHRTFVAEFLTTLIRPCLVEQQAETRRSMESRLEPFREAVALTADLLPNDVRLGLLPMASIDQSTLDAHTHAFRGLPAERLDDVLTTITDPIARVSAIAKLAPHGDTPTRINALCTSIVQFGGNLAIFTILLHAARAMWSAGTAQAIVEAVPRIDWENPIIQEHTKRALVHADFPFTRELASAVLDVAITQTSSTHARDVFELWRNAAQLSGVYIE